MPPRIARQTEAARTVSLKKESSNFYLNGLIQDLSPNRKANEERQGRGAASAENGNQPVGLPGESGARIRFFLIRKRKLCFFCKQSFLFVLFLQKHLGLLFATGLNGKSLLFEPAPCSWKKAVEKLVWSKAAVGPAIFVLERHGKKKFQKKGS